MLTEQQLQDAENRNVDGLHITANIIRLLLAEVRQHRLEATRRLCAPPSADEREELARLTCGAGCLYPSCLKDHPTDSVCPGVEECANAILSAGYRKESDIRHAAQTLSDRLHAIHNDPQYKAVWVDVANHGRPYTGPNYEKELADLDAALALPRNRAASVMCDECGKYPADLPSKLCSGCEAYREHTGAI
jgi:hypothetical protein